MIADLARSRRHRLDVARDLAGRSALLFDGAGDVHRDLAHPRDRLGDPADRHHRITGGRLHGGDLRGDFLGGLGGLVGQRLDLGRHHREATAGFAGTRRLNGRVQREQIGLRRDGVNELHDLADLLRTTGENLNRRVGALGIAHGLAGDFVGLVDLARDLGDRARQLFRCSCDRSDVIRSPLRRRSHSRRAGAGVARRCRHGFRRALHAGRRGRHRTHDTVDAALEAAGDAVHHRLALRSGAFLGFRVDLLEIADTDRVVLEDLHGRGHRADFVAAVAAGDALLELTVGQRLHADTELAERTGDAAADHPGNCTGDCADQKSGDSQRHDDGLQLGVEIVEIGTGADKHVPAGNSHGIGHLADRLLLAGFVVFVTQRHVALGGDTVAQFARQLAAVGFDLETVGADLLQVRRRDGDAVHGVDEHIAVALVVGHRPGNAGKFRDRCVLGHLPGIDLLLQPDRGVERAFHQCAGLGLACADHFTLHHVGGVKTGRTEAEQGHTDQDTELGGDGQVIQEFHDDTPGRDRALLRGFVPINYRNFLSASLPCHLRGFSFADSKTGRRKTPARCNDVMNVSA